MSYLGSPCLSYQFLLEFREVPLGTFNKLPLSFSGLELGFFHLPIHKGRKAGGMETFVAHNSPADSQSPPSCARGAFLAPCPIPLWFSNIVNCQTQVSHKACVAGSQVLAT